MAVTRVSTDGLADSAVNSAKIGVDVITDDDLANNSVTANEITNNAVTSNKIAANAVTSAKLDTNAVTSAKLDTNIAVSGNLDANVLRTASIKHTNDTAAMTIDSAGRMLFPNQVRFHAAGIPTDSTHNVYLQFGNVTNGMIVNSTHYTASSGTFTAPVAGTYMFYVGCIGANASTVYRLYPRKNNVDLYSPDASLHLRLDTRSTGGADEYASNASLVWMHTLAASDTMRVYSTVDDGSSNLYRSSGTKEYTYFGGYLIG